MSSEAYITAQHQRRSKDHEIPIVPLRGYDDASYYATNNDGEHKRQTAYSRLATRLVAIGNEGLTCRYRFEWPSGVSRLEIVEVLKKKIVSMGTGSVGVK